VRIRICRMKGNKMRLRYKIITLLFSFAIVGSSCENEVERQRREAIEEEERKEQEVQRQLEAEDRAFQEEQERIEKEEREEKERIERETRLEKERQEKLIYDKYITNSLRTGSAPYAYCFGENSSCDNYGCSQLKVKTPYNSDVVVTVKKDGEVVRHGYINGGSSLSFELPNGAYQPFFYYGKGWNPEKIMKETDCGTLKGGFVAEESFGKDGIQLLNNTILEYELILQEQGNFSTRPSNSSEAF